MINFNDFELNYLSTKDNQDTLYKYLDELPFGEEENNFKENSFGTEMMNGIFDFPNNSESMNQSLDNVYKNIQNIVPRNLFIIDEKIPKTEAKKQLGRKRKKCNETGVHDKYKEDNIIRKVKAYFQKSLFNLINAKLKKIDFLSKIKINGKILKKEEIRLLKVNQDNVKNISCKRNKQLLNEKIKKIFSVKISGSYTKYSSDFNSKLIEELYNIEKGEKVTCILDKTYLECLKYFRKDPKVIFDPSYSCLTGLTKDFEAIRKKLSKKNENDEEYINKFIGIINNFENIYYNKKERASRNKKE